MFDLFFFRLARAILVRYFKPLDRIGHTWKFSILVPLYLVISYWAFFLRLSSDQYLHTAELSET